MPTKMIAYSAVAIVALLGISRIFKSVAQQNINLERELALKDCCWKFNI